MPLMLYLWPLQHAGGKTANLTEFPSFTCTESKEKESSWDRSLSHLVLFIKDERETVVFLLNHGGTELNQLHQHGRDLKQNYDDSLVH